MASLIYSAIASLDGYIEDEEGNFNWSEPDAEVHSFINDLERGVGTHLLGRRLYETMAYWDTEEAIAGQPNHIRDFAAIWRAADKLVYSRTLEEVSTPRARLAGEFDAKAVRELKRSASADLTIGGANLAKRAFEAGLIDEVQLFLSPILVGGGKRALPDGIRLELELLDGRRFGNGVAYLRYAAR